MTLPMVVFESGSANIGQYSKLLSNGVNSLQSVEPKCVFLDIRVASESDETDVADDRLGKARVAAVRRFLLEAGFLNSNIGGQHRVINKTNQPNAFGLRHAEINWRWAKGRLRCDPATKQRPFAPACQGEYAACYLELDDGTVCNIYNAPEPNPSRYSVIPGNQ